MRGSITSIVVGMWVFLMTGAGALAATITSNPSGASLSIPAGASKTVASTVGVENIEFMRIYYTWVLDTVSGDLPKAWITVSPASAFLSEASSSLGVTYTVAVPDGTPSGTYSGTLYAKAKASHRTAEPGAGFVIEVTVPPLCSGIPKLVGVAVTPDIIWPPNRKMEAVTVSGSVEYPDGCGLMNFGYSIEDEYGALTSIGHAAVGADRNFSFPLPVEAWREGKDKDGRHYRITVFAEDEAGIGMSETLDAVVPHDQREK